MQTSKLTGPSLNGVRGKLDRAKAHLDHFKQVIAERSKAEALHHFRTDDETKQGVIETRLDQPPEVPLLARILIGDVVHSLAASLDHLVYQLSLSHQLAIGTRNAIAICDAHKTHFPIFDSPKNDAESRINKRLKLMAKEPADEIRAMQPYQRAATDPTLNAIEDPLWILYKLDVIDKHRVVMTTEDEVAVNRLTFTAPNKAQEVIEITNGIWHPFEHNQKILEVTLDPGQMPNPDVDLQVYLTLNIKFAETGLWCDGKPVIELLRKLIAFIEIAVVNRLAKYVV